VIDVLAGVMLKRGMLEPIRSDNSPEFVAKRLHHWLEALDAKPLSIDSGSPQENRYCESLNGTRRDELHDGERFCGLEELPDRRDLGRALQHGAGAFKSEVSAARAARLCFEARHATHSLLAPWRSSVEARLTLTTAGSDLRVAHACSGRS
jgi:transposase InsO family protein